MANLPSSTNGPKRKAQDNSASPLAQRPSHSQPESLPAMYPQPTARRLAQPDSIQAIIRDNCGTRLYLPPIVWTSNQLRVLTCQFLLQSGTRRIKQPTLPSLQDLDFQDDRGSTVDNAAPRELGRWRSSRAIRPVTRLGQLVCLEAKRLFVTELLDAYNIHRSDSQYLSFYFNRRAAVRLSTEGVYSTNSTTPSLAYITFDEIETLRSKRVYTPFGKRTSPPVDRIQQKKLKSLQPQNKAEDPYIVAILIALAQEQRRRHQQQQQSKEQDVEALATNEKRNEDADITSSVATSSTTRSSSCLSAKQMACKTADSFKVQVLAHPGVVADAFYVYTAKIPSAFLDKFDEPSQYSASRPITIKYYRLPMARSTTLRGLHRHICTGLCSFCSPNEAQDARTTC